MFVSQVLGDPFVHLPGRQRPGMWRLEQTADAAGIGFDGACRDRVVGQHLKVLRRRRIEPSRAKMSYYFTFARPRRISAAVCAHGCGT
jgi:hypothetical protein